MNSTNLQIQISAMAIMVQVEGMKADNAICAMRGEYPNHDESSFEMMASDLHRLMQDVDHN